MMASKLPIHQYTAKVNAGYVENEDRFEALMPYTTNCSGFEKLERPRGNLKRTMSMQYSRNRGYRDICKSIKLHHHNQCDSNSADYNFVNWPVSYTVFTSQYSGKGALSLSQLPEDLLADYQDREQLEDLILIIRCFQKYAPCTKVSEAACDELFSKAKLLLAYFTNFEARRPPLDNNSHEELTIQYAKIFLHHGGLPAVIDLLLYYSILPNSILHNSCSQENEQELRLKAVLLEFLTKLITTPEVGAEVAEELTQREDLQDHCFTWLSSDKTYLPACQLLEDLLQSRKTVVNLNAFSNLHAVASSLDSNKLANLCRMLSITISDLDIYENRSSLFAQNQQKRAKGFVNIRDVNQEVLLGIPDLLPRLIRFASGETYQPRYQHLPSELDNWIEWIDNSMTDTIEDDMHADDFENFEGMVSTMATAESPMIRQSSLRMCNDLILRVQVIYVLGLFLVGKHRKRVQRKMAELQIVPALNDLFDQFIWKCQGYRGSHHRLRGHSSSCECSPEVALKIQFLRLVHSFCDHSDYRHLLLCKTELVELKRINSRSKHPNSNLDKIDKTLMCRGSKGLLSKLVDVLKQEPPTSTFRFWLARAVESYLRSSALYCDQIFLMKRGLLSHTVSNIVDLDSRPKEILQSSFDLLGELMRFNFEAFQAFDKVLCTTEKQNRFLKIVDQNLVDSNMFIRSAMLSLSHFTQSGKSLEECDESKSLFLQHVAKFENQIHYLKSLIDLIKVQLLTQENISCLNSIVVFLMHANQKNEIPRYLKTLSSPEASTTATTSCVSSSSVTLINNFRDLLIFWQEYYLHKDKDCTALEKSSRISFEYWKATVRRLVHEDEDSEETLLHYMNPSTCAMANMFF